MVPLMLGGPKVCGEAVQLPPGFARQLPHVGTGGKGRLHDTETPSTLSSIGTLIWLPVRARSLLILASQPVDAPSRAWADNVDPPVTLIVGVGELSKMPTLVPPLAVVIVEPPERLKLPLSQTAALLEMPPPAMAVAETV